MTKDSRQSYSYCTHIIKQIVLDNAMHDNILETIMWNAMDKSAFVQPLPSLEQVDVITLDFEYITGHSSIAVFGIY